MGLWKKDGGGLLRKAEELEREGDKCAERGSVVDATVRYGMCLQTYGRISEEDRPADWNALIARVKAKLDAANA